MPKHKSTVPLIRNIFNDIEEYHGDSAAARSLTSAQKDEMRARHARELQAINVRLKALQQQMRVSKLYADAKKAGYVQNGTSTEELRERLNIMKLQMAPHVTKRSRARKSRMKKRSR